MKCTLSAYSNHARSGSAASSRSKCFVLSAYLGLSGKRKTSDDGLFTLETVACLGACGLAPVMTIDGEVHAKMDPDRAVALLEEIRAKEGSAQ